METSRPINALCYSRLLTVHRLKKRLSSAASVNSMVLDTLSWPVDATRRSSRDLFAIMMCMVSNPRQMPNTGKTSPSSLAALAREKSFAAVSKKG